MAIPPLKPPSAVFSLILGVVTAPAINAEASAAPAPMKASPTICSYTLGAIFETSNQKTRDQFLKECALDLKQVVKAFDECKITVRKVARVDGKEDKVADLELVVEGKQAFVLKDANRKDVALNVKKVQLGVSSINSLKPPTRYRFIISFEIDGKNTVKLLGVLDAEHTFTWGFISPDYGYDAEGKSFDPKTIYSK